MGLKGSLVSTGRSRPITRGARDPEAGIASDALDRPYPPGAYDVVVVGSGPGGLQTSYFLSRLGVRHAVLSADARPGGMFQRWPIFERLLSWSKLDAPAARDTVEYEWYDHNSLVADEPEHRALVPAMMSREFVVPTRSEMEAGLAAFAQRTGVRVRYGTRWEATRREDDTLVLQTSDGEYRCRAAVFAIGATEPWRSPIAGIEHVPHYAETREASTYRDRAVFVVGKRNSAFELADGLLPWARQLVLASPRPAQAAVLAHATVRARYLQPLEDYAVGGGTLVVDAAIERIERLGDGRFRIHAAGTTQPGRLEFTADDVIAATGFGTPLGDLPALGVATVAEGRLPALTPYWESISAPGVFFAGNVSQGAPGLRKHGLASNSAAVHGFRYNARALARFVASQRLGVPLATRPLRADDVVPLLVGDLARRPELWAQKGYLARAVTLSDGYADAGIVPLAAFVDEPGPDAVAVAVQADADGRLFPGVYLRRAGRVREIALDPHPLQIFDGVAYRRELHAILGLPSRTHETPRARPVVTPG